jgi:transcriptional regulator with XRE-family HTH domain
MLRIHELSEQNRNVAIGAALKLHRCAQSLSLQTLCQLAGVTLEKLRLIENGNIAIEIEELSRIVKVLKTSTSAFILRAEDIAEQLSAFRR